MDLVKLNEVTAEVIDYINENISKNMGLLALIKLSGSLKDASDEEIKAAQKQFKQKIKDAGYKLENKKYIPINAQKITDNLEIKEVEKVEVQTKSKRGRKPKPQKELRKKEEAIEKNQKELQDEYNKNHPFNNMEDYVFISTIYQRSKEIKKFRDTKDKRGTEKAVGINLYNSVAEKFKFLEEAYSLINNNIIVDTLINQFYFNYDNEYMEEYNTNLALILYNEKSDKKQMTYKISQDSFDKMEELRKGKYKEKTRTEFVNLVMLSCSDRFIIENDLKKEEEKRKKEKIKQQKKASN